jgi:hypothetical protein
MIPIFIGYDKHEKAAYQVACHSILERASKPVAITPVHLGHLQGVFTRERNDKQSTDFSFTRFLVPYLLGYEGWAIFMDCDVLVVDDIAKLWNLRDSRYAVQVVKHDHKPSSNVKFLGQPQTSYPKKNWSSVMLMDCSKCVALTPDYVNTASGLDLHRFNWLSDESLVGDIPHRWNHLVDYDPAVPVEQLSIVHYTDGGPYFTETANCGYSDEWKIEAANSMTAGK